MEVYLILEKLEQLEKLIVGSSKEILTVEDLINYTGFKRSYIYKLVHYNVIPYSKPNGKSLFFEKSEIDAWLLQNKSQSKSDIKKEALNYVNSKR